MKFLPPSIAILYGVLSYLSLRDTPVPITAFILIQAALWLFVITAWKKSAETLSIKTIFIWALLFRLIGLIAHPIYEDDFYRFLWDGWMFATTGNPYGIAPSYFFGTSATLPAHMDDILSAINHPEVPTIYSPFCQFVFLAAHTIKSGSLIALKGVFLLFDLIALLIMLRVCPRKHYLLFAWCPLLIFETSFNAHPEILGMTCVIAALYCWQKKSSWNGVFCAMALATKITALPVLPFLLWKQSWRTYAAFSFTFIALYVPFIIQGSSAEWEGLKAFGQHWEFNSSLYALLKIPLGPTMAKAIGLFLFAGSYAFIWLRWFKKEDNSKLPLDTVYGIFFLIAPVVNAWYLLWMLPFVVLRPRYWSVTALAVVTLAYIAGHSTGLPGLTAFDHPWWLRPIEFGLIAIALSFDLLKREAK